MTETMTEKHSAYLEVNRREKLDALRTDNAKREQAVWVLQEIPTLIEELRQKNITSRELFSEIRHCTLHSLIDLFFTEDGILLFEASDQEWNEFFASVRDEAKWLNAARMGFIFRSDALWYDQQLGSLATAYEKRQSA